MEIVGPKINTAFTFYLPLVTSGSDDFKATPTIAAGDCKVSIDGGATFSNPATLPSETAAGSKIVQFPLAAGEMNAALVIVKMIDQTATKEWKDTVVFIRTTTHGVGNANVSAIDNNAISAAAIASDAITAAKIADGAIDAGALASDAITAAKIAADAISSSELADAAAVEIANKIGTSAAISGRTGGA